MVCWRPSEWYRLQLITRTFDLSLPPYTLLHSTPQITYVDVLAYELLDVLRLYDSEIYGSELTNLTVS